MKSRIVLTGYVIAVCYFFSMLLFPVLHRKSSTHIVMIAIAIVWFIIYMKYRKENKAKSNH